jgi:hypothetical protein
MLGAVKDVRFWDGFGRKPDATTTATQLPTLRIPLNPGLCLRSRLPGWCLTEGHAVEVGAGGRDRVDVAAALECGLRARW